MIVSYANGKQASKAVRSVKWSDFSEVLSIPRKAEISTSFICRDELGSVVGLLLSSYKKTPNIGDNFHLGSLSIEESKRNNGIGSKLLERFARLADRHKQYSSLEVNHKSDAIRLYERFGFHVVNVSCDGEVITMLRPYTPT